MRNMRIYYKLLLSFKIEFLIVRQIIHFPTIGGPRDDQMIEPLGKFVSPFRLTASVREGGEPP